MKRLLILGLVFLISLFSVNAGTLAENTDIYYKFDGNFADATGNFTSQNNGATQTTGILNNGSNYDGAADYVSTGFRPSANVDAFSINAWVRPDTLTGTHEILSVVGATNNRIILRQQDATIVWFLRNDAGSQTLITSTHTINTGTYQMVTGTWDGKKLRVYINGTLSQTGIFTGTIDPEDGFVIGARNSTGAIDLFWDGDIDEVATVSRNLTVAEITNFYNAGAPTSLQQFPYVAPTSAITFNNIGLTEGQFFNNENISIVINLTTSNTNNNTNVSRSLDGGAFSSCFTLSLNGNCVLTGLSEGAHNITFYAFNNETNTTSATYNFTIDTTFPQLTVNLPTEYNFYTGFNFSQYINFSDTNLDTCIVSISNEGTTLCTEQNFNFTYNGNHTINVSVNDTAGNINSSLNNIMLINPTISFRFNDSGTLVDTFTFGSKSTTGIEVNYSVYGDSLVLGNNTFQFSKAGYITQSFTFIINTTTAITQVFNIFPAFINVNIYDATTLALITDLVSLTLVGPVGDNLTTTTGTANFNFINKTAGNYQIIASSENYTTESVYFTATTQENITIDIYMIGNITNAGIINIQVKDTLSNLVEGAIVSALEWRTSSSSYVSVAECQTNANGLCQLNIQLNNRLYKFQAVKNSVTKTTNSQIITTSGTTLTITLEDVTLTQVPTLDNLLYNFTETLLGNISVTRLEWTDSLGTVGTACIKVYRNDGFSQTLLKSNCTNSASGILFSSNAVNNTYAIQIIGSITYDGVTYVLGVFNHQSIINLTDTLEQYNLDMYIPIIFLFIAIASGLFFGNVYISLALAIVLEWIAFLIVPGIITGSVAVVITIISILTLWGINKR